MNILHELKSGEIVTTPTGKCALVKRLSRQAIKTLRPEFDEPLYRLIYQDALGTGYTVTGSHVWTLEALAAAGVTAR